MYDCSNSAIIPIFRVCNKMIFIYFCIYDSNKNNSNMKKSSFINFIFYIINFFVKLMCSGNKLWNIKLESVHNMYTRPNVYPSRIRNFFIAQNVMRWLLTVTFGYATVTFYRCEIWS